MLRYKNVKSTKKLWETVITEIKTQLQDENEIFHKDKKVTGFSHNSDFL